MKYIVLLLIFVASIYASVIKTPILNINGNIATIKIDKIDIGMSGFIIHKIAKNHSAILKSIVVKSYDKNTKIATLALEDYTSLDQDSLPNGKWHVEVGDTALLAFAYSRAFLVAPSEEIYHRITSNTNSLQWIHPDLFAMILSLNSHPTPLREDFDKLSTAASVGIIFIYLDKKAYTLDAKSFKILNISDTPLVQDSVKLPFYTRVDKIESNFWNFGEGSDEMQDYESHYYELMIDANKNNKELYAIVKNGNKKLRYLLSRFE